MFNRKNVNDFGIRHVAPGPEASLSESLQSSYDLVKGVYRSDSFHRLEYDRIKEYLDEVEAITGDRPVHPMDGADPFMAETPGGFEFSMEQFFADQAKLREVNPRVPEFTRDTLLQDLGDVQRQLEERRADVAAREGVAGSIAGFAGGAAAAVTDPLALLSMFAGAPVAAGFLRTVLTEAGIAAATEVPIQAAVAGQQTALGRPIDYETAALSILLAGAGGGVLSGTILGGIRGTRALLAKVKELPASKRTPQVRAAEKYLERLQDLEERNPFVPNEAGRAAHAGFVDASLARISGRRTARDTLMGTAARLPEEPASLARVEASPVLNPRGRESVDEYAGRILAENPEVFENLKVLNARGADVQRRIAEIDERIEALPPAPSEVKALRKEVAQLRKGKKTATRTRKLAQAEEKLGRLDSEARLKAERKVLQSERKRLTGEAKGLEKQVKQLIKETPIRNRSEPAWRITQTARGLPSGETRDLVEQAIAAGKTGREALADRPAEPLPPEPRQVENSTAEELEALTQAARDPEAVTAELQALRDSDPDYVLDLVDDEGNLISTTVDDVMNILDEERKVLDEMQKCLRGL